jgi:hypothetical protein
MKKLSNSHLRKATSQAGEVSLYCFVCTIASLLKGIENISVNLNSTLLCCLKASPLVFNIFKA